MHAPVTAIDAAITRTAASAATDIVITALWFGLCTGLIEGLGFLVLQALHWMSWNMAMRSVSVEIVWIAACVDAVLFGALGLCCAAVARRYPDAAVPAIVVAVLAFLAAFDWLAISGRLAHYAEVMLAAGMAAAVTRGYRRSPVAWLRFWRRTLPSLALLAVLAGVAIQTGLWWRERVALAALPPLSPAAPNVLVIVVDTLRTDHLSAYGYARRTSPAVEAAAADGVLFENAIAGSAWTPPSHASLLTGRLPREHGVEWSRHLDSRYPTLAEALLRRGYRTAAFSANTVWFSRRMGFGRGFIHFDDYFYSVGDSFLRTLYGRVFERLAWRPLELHARKHATQVNATLLRWIDARRERPFFAFLNYLDTHAPYVPAEPYRSRFAVHPGAAGVLSGNPERDAKLTPVQVQDEIDAYDGEIAYIDDEIGKLLGALQQRGLTQRTLVVITSDHGELFGEHGLFEHRNSLYRGVVQVPLILRWPGHVPAGVRIARPVSNVALPATVLDLLDDGGPQEFPGPALAALWQVPESAHDWPWPRAQIAQQPFPALRRYPTYHGAMQTLITPQWHYIEHETLGRELYDWQHDVQERDNLAARPELQDLLAQLHAELATGGAPSQP